MFSLYKEINGRLVFWVVDEVFAISELLANDWKFKHSELSLYI